MIHHTATHEVSYTGPKLPTFPEGFAHRVVLDASAQVIPPIIWPMKVSS